MMGIRESVLAKLAQARSVLDELFRRKDSEGTAIEWQKGYVKALEEILELDGLSLRQSPRRLTAIPAIVRPETERGGQGGKGTIVDLSEGGCRLEMRTECSVGEIIELSFALPGAREPVTLQGWVRRVQRIDDEVRMGVEFKDTPGAIARALGAFCAPEVTAEKS